MQCSTEAVSETLQNHQALDECEAPTLQELPTGRSGLAFGESAVSAYASHFLNYNKTSERINIDRKKVVHSAHSVAGWSLC